MVVERWNEGIEKKAGPVGEMRGRIDIQKGRFSLYSMPLGMDAVYI